jgi:ABC-type antimicrobial peptide transport system permease subunit
MAERVQSVVRGIEPQARVTARLLADDLGKVVRRVAVVSRIAWAVGLLALLLATAGAFGVFAYMVEERRREIAVRIAIGAQPRQVVWTVIRDARRPLVFGLGAGLLLSSVVGLLLGRFLYGLSPFDPITYAGISVILITAAVVAMWTPARRATLIEPAIVLRGD